MRRIFLAALSLLFLLLTPCAPIAAVAPGPVWWKISNGGGSTLWILGIPDGMMMDAKWDDASLRVRLSSARLLISPLLGRPVSEPQAPGGAWTYAISTTPGAAAAQGGPIHQVWGRTLGMPDTARSFTDTLSRRLPPEMMARVEKALSGVTGNTHTDMLNSKTWELALWLDLWNWPRGMLENPVTDRAQELAKGVRVPIQAVHVAALWKPLLLDAHGQPAGSEPYADFDWLYEIRPNARIEPPEDVQQTCLDQVLTQTESGRMPAVRQAAMEAWAHGDLDNALKRSNTVQLCLMGEMTSTDAAAFEAGQAYTYINLLDQAFLAPGQTVALVEFDPLLLENGGVLDHFKRLGYDITRTRGMED